jgi:hypothetical protein
MDWIQLYGRVEATLRTRAVGATSKSWPRGAWPRPSRGIGKWGSAAMSAAHGHGRTVGKVPSREPSGRLLCGAKLGATGVAQAAP